MKFARLVIRNITRSKSRSLLTVAGIAVSMLIFCALLSLDRGVDAMIEQSGGDDVLVVFDKYAGCPSFSKLPVHYSGAIAEVPGVQAVMPVRFLLSNCGTTTALIAIHGIEAEVFRQFRDIEISDAEYSSFAGEKGATIVGIGAAEKYGWQVGQNVTLPQLGGIGFTVRGIFSAPGDSLEDVVLVDREYLEQAIEQVGIVTLIMVKLKDHKAAAQVAAAIDENFRNYEKQTVTGPEKSFIGAQVDSFRDMVDFAQWVAYLALALLLAAVANSVSMSVRDRLREMALLKLVGFDSDGLVRMILAESALTGMLASTAAVLIAIILTSTLRLGISVEGYTMRPEMSSDVVITSLLAGLLLSLIGAWLPSAGVSRRPIVAALKEVD